MKLAEYMDLRGLSDIQFAAIVSCARSTVTRWRNGTTRPTPDQIMEIQRVTNGAVTPNDWFAIAAE